MKTTLYEFQQKAVDKAYSVLDDFQKEIKEGTCDVSPRALLTGPCGVGKTVLMSSIIEKLMCDSHMEKNRLRGKNGSLVILLTPGKGNLEEQTRKSIHLEVADSGIEVKSLKEDGVLESIPGTRTVVTCNYEALVQHDRESGEYLSLITRDGEKSNFWDFLDTVNRENRQVFIVTDEAHIGNQSDSPKISKLISEIRRKVRGVIRLEVTATPIKEASRKNTIIVDRRDAVECGLIRRRIILNCNRKEDDKSRRSVRDKLRKIDPFLDCDDGELVDLMYTKYGEVYKEIYNEQYDKGTTYNPLMLIAVSNGKAGTAEIEMYKRYFASHGITEGNGTLAIHTSDKSLPFSKQEELKRVDSVVKVLIFKVSVALGWDCPRAQFLLVSRKVANTSTVFVDQIVGRIGRSVRGTHRPNGQVKSSHGYVYTQVNKGFFDDRIGVAVEYANTVDANEDQLALWNSSGIVRSVQKRGDRGGITANGETLKRHVYTDALNSGRVKRLKITGTRSVTRNGTITKTQDLKHDEDKIVPFENADVSDSYLSTMRWEVQMKLQERMRAAGVKVVGKHAEIAVEPFMEFIRRTSSAMKKTSMAQCYRSVLHDMDKGPENGNVVKMMDQLALVSKEWEDSTTRNAFSRVYHPYSPMSCRYLSVDRKPRKLPKGVVEKHLYGPNIVHGTDSEPEERFEEEVLKRLLDLSVLLSWYRNSEDIDSYGTAFSMGFPNGDSSMWRVHKKHTTPDYMILLRGKDGNPIAVAIETKSYSDIRNGCADRGEWQSIHDKVVIMEQQTASNDDVGKRGHGEEKGAHVAAVVYRETSGRWMVQPSDTAAPRVDLLTWLSEYADFTV